MASTGDTGGAGLMLRGRALEASLLTALATLATVLAKTAVVADRGEVKGPLVVAAPAGWLWLLRRVRAWVGGDLADAGRR